MGFLFWGLVPLKKCEEVISNNIEKINSVIRENCKISKIDPKDIADIVIGQDVKISLTEYDPSLYGRIDGKVLSVSADAISDKQRPNLCHVTLRFLFCPSVEVIEHQWCNVCSIIFKYLNVIIFAHSTL